MKTNVYIDGFNLYYRAVKNTSYKWLDIYKVCQKLVPSHQINQIRYFTANPLPLPNDPQVPVRHQIYIRALETIPNLTIHRGHYRLRQSTFPLAKPIAGLPSYVEVKYFDEKGSDVNLATHLLFDGFSNDYEQAVVISNDSDLAEPITLIKEKLHLPVGVVNPNANPTHITPAELTAAATFTRRLRTKTLQDCQFPPTLIDAKGEFSKPASW